MTKQHICATDTDTPVDPLEAEIFDTTSTIRKRIALFAKWFDLEAPEIETNDEGKILLSDDLYNFISTEGASFDWIFLGAVKGMVHSHRQECKSSKKLQKTIGALDDVEIQYLLKAFRFNDEGLASFEDALSVCKEALDEYRANKARSHSDTEEAA